MKKNSISLLQAVVTLTVAVFSALTASAQTGPRLKVYLPGQTVPESPSNRDVIAWGTNTWEQTDVPRWRLTKPVEIAAGDAHSLALQQDGTVVGWGVGDRYFQNPPSYGQATPPANLSGVVAIAAGHYHSVALKHDGTVVCWGTIFSAPLQPPTELSGVVAITAGRNFTAALKQDGTVVLWGYTASGQLNVPPSLDDVVAIAAGDYHMLALKREGSVVAWGTTAPVGLSNVRAIFAGGSSSAALKTDGTVVSWGTALPESTQSIGTLALGQYCSAVAGTDGSVAVWGNNYHHQMDVPANLRDVSTLSMGTTHVVALTGVRSISFGTHDTSETADQTVRLQSTGDLPLQNLALQIMGPSADQFSFVGVPLPGELGVSCEANLTVRFSPQGAGRRMATLRISSNSNEAPVHEVQLLGVARSPSLEVQAPSTIASGSEIRFERFRVSNAPQMRMITIRNVGGADLKNISIIKDGLNAADFVVEPLPHSRLKPGETMSVGVGFAPLAHGARSAVLHIGSSDLASSPFDIMVSGEGQAIRVATSGATIDTPINLGTFTPGEVIERTFTISNDGNNAITGLSISVVGLGRDQLSLSAIPAAIGSGEMVVVTMRFAASMEGEHHWRLVLQSEIAGARPTYVELSARVLAPVLRVTTKTRSDIPNRRIAAWGYGGFGQTSIPQSIGNPTSTAAGRIHSVVLNDSGRVTAFGNNDYNQSPTSFGIDKVNAVAAGMHHTLALQNNGRVSAWGGYKPGGQSNDYWFQQSSVPSNLSDVAAIAAGWLHSVALKKDGSVETWGADIAKPPSGLSDVVAIAAGWGFTVALKRDGKVVAWGANNSGQTAVPSGLSGVVAVAAGRSFAIALKSDGTVAVWGSGAPWDISNATDVKGIVAGGETAAAIYRDGTFDIFGYRYRILSNGEFVEDKIPEFRKVESLSLGDSHGLAIGIKDDALPFAREVSFRSMALGDHLEKSLAAVNIGTLPLHITSIRIAGADADQFSVVPTSISAIATDASSPFIVRFTPRRVGPLQAQLNMVSDDPAAPTLSLKLSGTGVFYATATKPNVANSPFIYSPLRLDRQTGLLLQKITFTNTTGVLLNGLRLLLSKVAPGVQVYSSSAGTAPGTFEVIYSNAIKPNETISFDLVYFDPRRRTAESMNPVIKAEALLEPEPDSLPVKGTAVPLLRARSTPQGPTLEWNSAPAKTYVVEYSDNGGTTWLSAVHRLNARGTRMFWLDRGQPETKTKPVGVPNLVGGRYYRVKRL